MYAYVYNLERQILSNSLKLSSSWGANRLWAGHGVRQIFWNPRVYHHVHKGLFLLPILSQAHPVHAILSYCLKNHCNVILPSFLRSSFFMTQQAYVGLGLLTVGGFEITLRRTILGRSPLNEWQHTILTRDRHPCCRRDSNPQSQQASGRRPKRSRGHQDRLPCLYA
jgi:hypothetical protein